MKTIVLVVFLTSVMILGSFRGQAEASDPVKNRRFLSVGSKGWGSTDSADPRREMAKTTNVVDDDSESSPEQSTHHVFTDETFKPPH
ncbi:hypothetical protein C2S52_014372 [Perilla frutescens var. hirtella]|nr:hypothetical protein C2S52_014372 [Perilla frutescens var. hirtella]KAH6816764.1 hypothetical protein C2S51_021584 [Perilla frutescens var. frutescens]